MLCDNPFQVEILNFKVTFYINFQVESVQGIAMVAHHDGISVNQRLVKS
jgi:hypothetical protein